MLRRRAPFMRSSVVNDTVLSTGRPERMRGFGIAAWFRADKGTTIATGVSQWDDLSGNARNLAQGTGANQPTLVASGPNGKQSISFDGSNDLLTAAYTENQPTQVTIAFKTTAGTPSVHDCIFDGGALLGMAFFVDTTPQTYMFAGTAQPITGSSFNNGTYGVTTCQYNGASAVLRNNRAQVATGNCNTGDSGGITLGAVQNASRHAVCEIAEVVILATIGDASSTYRLERYMQARYGTP